MGVGSGPRSVAANLLGANAISVLVMFLVTSLLLGIAVPAEADHRIRYKKGDKYNRNWSIVEYSPQVSGWSKRRFTEESVSGSRGETSDISHWYRDELRVGIRYQSASSTNWNVINSTNGLNKTNWKCRSDGSGCDWDVRSYDSSWQYTWEASYIVSRTRTRTFCKPGTSCGDFSTTTEIRIYSPGWS